MTNPLLQHLQFLKKTLWTYLEGVFATSTVQAFRSDGTYTGCASGLLEFPFDVGK